MCMCPYFYNNCPCVAVLVIGNGFCCYPGVFSWCFNGIYCEGVYGGNCGGVICLHIVCFFRIGCTSVGSVGFY